MGARRGRVKSRRPLPPRNGQWKVLHLAPKPRYEAAVVRFFLGFLVASLLWGGLLTLVYLGALPFPYAAPAAEQTSAALEPEAEAGETSGKPKRKRPKVEGRNGTRESHKPRSGAGGAQMIGDELDWNGSRELNMAAGEAQLSGKQIETGFDSVMGKIRRCLILVPSDDEVSGKLLFGMRVGNDGKPRAVQLTGPSIVIGGESGSCLREAAQAIRFASFDGPDMLFKYPITLH